MVTKQWHNTATNLLSSVLFVSKKHQGADLVALSACSLLLNTSGGPLAAEDSTCPSDCCIFQISSVEVLTTQVLDGLDSATGVASKGHLSKILGWLVCICKITMKLNLLLKTTVCFWLLSFKPCIYPVYTHINLFNFNETWKCLLMKDYKA